MTLLRINLEQDEIATHCYTVVADMAHPPAPPLAPDGQPVPPEVLGAILPELAMAESLKHLLKVG